MSLSTWTLVALLAAAQAPEARAAQAPGSAAGPAPAAAQPQAAEPATLPVSIDRIREALSHEPTIRPNDVPMYRVEVIGTMPSLEVMLGKEFWKGGAARTPGGAVMTHQEFLNMVTPPEFRGPALFTPGEALTVAATSVALQWALQKAIAKYKAAKDVRAQEDARREVREALEALDKARAAAGLPRR